MNGCLRSLGEKVGLLKPHRPANRTVFVGNEYPPSYETHVPESFIDNTVISSKYTVWNFLPKNLFEQFRRVANFYFLVVAFIQVIIDSPVSPATSIVPLILVVMVTAIKQGYEDRLRHKTDNEVNNRPAYVIRNGQEVEVKSKDIKVGDIVKVVVNHGFPCDMVMLSSHDDEGECTVTTANLDGETNLKTFVSLSETRCLQTPDQLETLRATIECQQPIDDLYRFIGRMHISMPSGGSGGSGEQALTKSLGPENLLLRGARLKNTLFVYGCAVYTGQESKMALNSTHKKIKFSRVERSMNIFLLTFLIILISETLLCTGLKYIYLERSDAQPWYLPSEQNSTGKQVAQNFFAFLVLFNYIIPISLYVTVEMQKFFGSMFFGVDAEMYDEISNERCKANTSDLNEELGQVEYLFTDKTGTLTENDMQFRRCSVNGVRYVEEGGMLCQVAEVSGIPHIPVTILTSEIENLLMVLVLCHTVRVDHTEIHNGNWMSNGEAGGHQYEYHASSPDEKAFIEACQRFGIIYHGTRDDLHEITVKGQLRRYKRLHVLDFDPTRKRMSVITEDGEGQKYLLCKGAETAMLPVTVSGEHDQTLRHVNEYAVLGLRTLVIGHKKLTNEEFDNFDKALTSARQALENREQKLSQVYDLVERDLDLLGATAVEDRLQEGVPDTISALREAGIKVWILTGDKEETAVNISHSAGHFKSDMVVLRVAQQSTVIQCAETLVSINKRMLEEPKADFALVIDGISLALCLKDHAPLLRSICIFSSAVLCCRMSPLQKAEVVKLIKNSKGSPVTAAIGDGANDVSMIQEAHIGLGVYGKEGRQAARCSDYAFGRFRFVKRALLVHGHYFYIRIAMLVQYFFYKNVAFITAQVYYAFLTAFSAQSIYESYFLLLYNITFSSLPILIYGLFEQNIPQKTLLENPKLYKSVTRNSYLSAKEFIKWNSLGLWHSLVFTFGVYWIFGVQSLNSQGMMLGVWEFGALIITTCVFAVNFKLCLETYHWTGVTHFAFWLTIVGFFFLVFVYQSIWWVGTFVAQQYLYGKMANLFSNISVWLTMLLLMTIALLPDLLLRVTRDCCWDMKNKFKSKVSKYNQKSRMNISFTKRSATLTISTTNILEAS